MRLTPQEPEIPKVGGFTDENDIFGYRKFAERLANLVHNIDEPLVIVLDGPWGSGKSVAHPVPWTQVCLMRRA